MEDKIANCLAGRTAQDFIAIPEIVVLGAWVEMRDNDTKGNRAPYEATNRQCDTQPRKLVLPDQEKAQDRKGKRNIFFARGCQDAGQNKPAIALVSQCQHGIQQKRRGKADGMKVKDVETKQGRRNEINRGHQRSKQRPLWNVFARQQKHWQGTRSKCQRLRD